MVNVVWRQMLRAGQESRHKRPAILVYTLEPSPRDGSVPVAMRRKPQEKDVGVPLEFSCEREIQRLYLMDRGNKGQEELYPCRQGRTLWYVAVMMIEHG